jgi:hypothetical protein
MAGAFLMLGDKSTYQAQLQQDIANVIREAQKATTDGIDERIFMLREQSNVKNALLTPLP